MLSNNQGGVYMQLELDKDSRILNFALIGSFVDAVEVELDSNVEDEFISNFVPKKYIYQDGKIIEDSEYKEPQPPTQGNVQNPLQVALGQLTLQVATLQESNKKLSESLGQMALMMAKQDEEGGK